MVYRSDRRGWYVANQELIYGLTNSVSFMENIRSKGNTAKSRILDVGIQKPNDAVRKKLQLSKVVDVYVIRRVFCIDERPAMMETLYAPASRFPGLLEFPLEESLTPLWLEHYDVRITRSEVQLTSNRYSLMEAQDLEVTEGEVGIHISHLYFDHNGAPVGYDLQKWRAESVVFSMNLEYK